MRILFFFVHPAKYHLFKHTINRLLKEGYSVEIAIISKDVLEDLIRQEGWKYTNIFPEGRRIKNIPILISTSINFIKTLWRLWVYTNNKKFDLFVTDDCLTIIGKIKKIPSLMFTDNELSTIPESSLLLHTSTKILAPACVLLGKYEEKKIPFNGYKELTYLHPNYYKPNPAILKKIKAENSRYFVLRVVSMTASHDRGIKGITDSYLEQLVDLLKPYGKIFISSERKLPEHLKKHELKIESKEIFDVISYADLFISDSGTMSSEAAVLGTPSIMFHDFIGRLKVMEEKEKKYGLMFGYRPDQFAEMVKKIKELAENNNLREEWMIKKMKMLDEKEDLNKLMYSIFTNPDKFLHA